MRLLKLAPLLFALAAATPAFGQAFTGPATITQPTTPGDCVKVDTDPQSPSNLLDTGSPCGTGSGGVTSFNTRTGAVVPATNDYSFSQLSGSIAASQTSALTGDVTKPAGSSTTTLVNIPAISGVNLTNLNAGALASGLVPLARGGTNADLSATGGASNVLRQSSGGAAVTVGRLACADLSDASTGCSGAASAVGANPTATIGASAVNGSAATFMRSDAAPPLPATLPALSGVNLTALNGSNIASGTVADARLSSNVPLKNGANVFTTMQVFNLNTAGAPTPITGAVVQVVGADAANGFVENDTFGATPIFTGRRADGTGASPTAVQSAEALAGFSARPYDGTGYTSASTGNVQAVANEGFSATNHGTDLVGNCTAITTTTTAECWRAKSSGFTIPTGSTYQINGTQITTAALSNSANIALLNAANTFTAANIVAGPSLGASSTASAFTITSTWNDAGTSFKGALLVNVTNMVSNAASLLADLQIGGVSQFKVTRAGVGTFVGGLSASSLTSSTNVSLGGAGLVLWNARSVISSLADGNLTIQNNGQTDFSRLQFGGTTSSFPALKRSSASLSVRLADDSADAAITAAAATLSGTLTASSGHVEAPRIVTAAGAVTMATTDYVVVVNKTVGAATTVNLPSSPTTGQHYYIKDGKGDAATNNITVTPAAGNIDGAGTLVMNVNYMAIELTYNGTQWNVI